MTSTSATLPSPTWLQASRWLTLVAVWLLIALGLAWELWLAPTGRGTLAIKVAPLLLALPGLWRGRLNTFRWLSLLVWLYVTEGLVRATSETGRGAILAVGEVVLATLIFCACVWQIRLRRVVAAA